MRKRSVRKTPKSPAILTSPPTQAPSDDAPTPSPGVAFKFNLDDVSSSPKVRKKEKSLANIVNGISSPLKNVSSISELKSLVSSEFDSVKRLMERSHSEILKDVEASQNRLHKRLQIQTQACQQAKDEAEKEFKKISERISAGHEAMMASYAEFVAEVQTTASRPLQSAKLPSLSFPKVLNKPLLRFEVDMGSPQLQPDGHKIPGNEAF